jgi:hypothetical protein
VVFDFFPYNEPENELYWKLSAKNKFQEDRAKKANKKDPSKPISNVAVSIEHVLEWNTLLQFINCKSSQKRCEHFAKWFGEEIDVDTKMPLQKWNLDGTDNGAATEIPFQLNGVTAIDWITKMYPGTAAQSAYEHEFVSLHDDVNGRKEHVRPTLLRSSYHK